MTRDGLSARRNLQTAGSSLGAAVATCDFGTTKALRSACSTSLTAKRYGACELRDGHLLSWSSDDRLRLWAPDGALLTDLTPHEGLTGARVLRDGRFLSWGIDGSLWLWRSDGTKLGELKGHQSKVNGALELTNGIILSWADSSSFAGALLDAALTCAIPEDISAALENAAVYISSSDCSLRLWTRDGAELAVLKRHLPPQ